MKVIKTCFEIYRYLDYVHDQRRDVPLQSLDSQPPKYLIDAYFFKMKADYMKFIFETLDCEDGLLNNQTEKIDFSNIIRQQVQRDFERNLDEENIGNNDIEGNIDLIALFKNEIQRSKQYTG